MARLSVVEDLRSIAEDLQLPSSAGADFHVETLLAGGIAQAHGRASQIKSKETALHFDHWSFQTSLAARIVFTWMVTVSSTLRA